MVGHFYPQELRDKNFGFPEIIQSKDSLSSIRSEELILDLIRLGKHYAENFMNDSTCLGFFENEQSKKTKFKYGMVNRKEVSLFMSENMLRGNKPLLLSQYSDYVYEGGMSESSMLQFVEVGIEEYLDLYFPYQERRIILFNK